MTCLGEKSGSLHVSDSKRPFLPASVPTVEVNVVSSDKGDDNLSLTTKSVEKIPLMSIPNFRSIYETREDEKHKLAWSNKVRNSLICRKILQKLLRVFQAIVAIKKLAMKISTLMNLECVQINRTKVLLMRRENSYMMALIH